MKILYVCTHNRCRGFLSEAITNHLAAAGITAYSAAGETCPLWMGNSLKVHWALPDPSRIEGTDSDIAAVFHSLMDTIEKGARRLLALDAQAVNRTERQRARAAIGEAV